MGSSPALPTITLLCIALSACDRVVRMEEEPEPRYEDRVLACTEVEYEYGCRPALDFEGDLTIDCGAEPVYHRGSQRSRVAVSRWTKWRESGAVEHGERVQVLQYYERCQIP